MPCVFPVRSHMVAKSARVLSSSSDIKVFSSNLYDYPETQSCPAFRTEEINENLRMGNASKPITLNPLKFEEAVSALLKVKPMPKKPKKKSVQKMER